ncbi:MAG: ferritin-like domain-containing protein [Desulfurococcales archaeon]|nr:ferritin-like domain-containing protein [Desulfurococcales archaeon]MCE4626122.1 ferritin-like domain-containing protein [Desulfurococcales archaeon]
MSEEILELIKVWLKDELTYAARLRKLADSLKHPVLKALFSAIAKDSEKHNLILTGMKEYLENNRPFITEEDIDAIKKSIKEHIEEESHSIKELTRLKEQVKDPAILLLVEAMLEDEMRHHALLVQIEKIIAQKEKITDQELWESLWLHSPYHGAPGG